jgi:hypothetical protein
MWLDISVLEPGFSCWGVCGLARDEVHGYGVDGPDIAIRWCGLLYNVVCLSCNYFGVIINNEKNKFDLNVMRLDHSNAIVSFVTF